MLIEPPRAEHCVAPDDLPFFERQGDYVLQFKRNGSYSVIEKKKDGSVVVLNRHGEPHKAWHLTNENGVKDFFERLPTGIFCAETLHSKVKNIRDLHYFHDVLSVNGELLLGKTYEERHRILSEILFGHPMGWQTTPAQGHWVIMKDRIWLARNYVSHFRPIFDSLKEDMDEGVVVKKAGYRLAIKNHSGWSFKTRRPNKNLAF
jgi:hypothetical protein